MRCLPSCVSACVRVCIRTFTVSVLLLSHVSLRFCNYLCQAAWSPGHRDSHSLVYSLRRGGVGGWKRPTGAPRSLPGSEARSWRGNPDSKRPPRAAVPRSPPLLRGPRCACRVGGVNGSVAGGAPAAGDAGKPGAPEDAPCASAVWPEERRGRKGAPRPFCRGHGWEPSLSAAHPRPGCPSAPASPTHSLAAVLAAEGAGRYTCSHGDDSSDKVIIAPTGSVRAGWRRFPPL